jgi:hypothetical protein
VVERDFYGMNCHINQQVRHMQKEKKSYFVNFEQPAIEQYSCSCSEGTSRDVTIERHAHVRLSLHSVTDLNIIERGWKQISYAQWNFWTYARESNRRLDKAVQYRASQYVSLLFDKY